MSIHSGNLISGLMSLVQVAEEKALIDHLTYSSYAHNRRISPKVAPERWAKIFPTWERMEAIYQRELTGEVERAEKIAKGAE